MKEFYYTLLIKMINLLDKINPPDKSNLTKEKWRQVKRYSIYFAAFFVFLFFSFIKLTNKLEKMTTISICVRSDFMLSERRYYSIIILCPSLSCFISCFFTQPWLEIQHRRDSYPHLPTIGILKQSQTKCKKNSYFGFGFCHL